MGAAPQLRDSEPGAAVSQVALAVRRLMAMLLMLTVLVGIAVVINLAANPYGIWRASLIDPIYRRLGLEDARVATPYILQTANADTLLLGTSRMFLGIPIEQINRDGVTNAGMARATLDEISAMLDTALTWSKPKRIIWALDFEAFQQSQEGLADPDVIGRLRNSPGLALRDGLMSLYTLEFSRRMVFRELGGISRIPSDRLAPIPWELNTIRTTENHLCCDGLASYSPMMVEYDLQTLLVALYRDYVLSPHQLATFSSICEKAHRSGAELLLFIPPFSAYELETIRQNGRWQTFQQFRRAILKAGPYWDFSGYNEMAHDDRLFLDVEHFKPTVGHLILRLLEGNHDAANCCGELSRELAHDGVWVTPKNIDETIAHQDSGMRAEPTNSKYVTTVAALLAGKTALVPSSAPARPGY